MKFSEKPTSDDSDDPRRESATAVPRSVAHRSSRSRKLAVASPGNFPLVRPVIGRKGAPFSPPDKSVEGRKRAEGNLRTVAERTGQKPTLVAVAVIIVDVSAREQEGESRPRERAVDESPARRLRADWGLRAEFPANRAIIRNQSSRSRSSRLPPGKLSVRQRPLPVLSTRSRGSGLFVRPPGFPGTTSDEHDESRQSQ